MAAAVFRVVTTTKTVKELRIILEGLIYTMECMLRDVIAGVYVVSRNYVQDCAVERSEHAGPMHPSFTLRFY